MKIQALRDSWHNTMRVLGAQPGDDVLDDLIARWSEPHRHYHVLGHLTHCLHEISDLPFASRGTAELAAWFHDAVYVTKPGAPNEKESADLAREKLGPLGIDTAKI